MLGDGPRPVLAVARGGVVILVREDVVDTLLRAGDEELGEALGVLGPEQAVLGGVQQVHGADELRRRLVVGERDRASQPFLGRLGGRRVHVHPRGDARPRRDAFIALLCGHRCSSSSVRFDVSAPAARVAALICRDEARPGRERRRADHAVGGEAVLGLEPLDGRPRPRTERAVSAARHALAQRDQRLLQRFHPLALAPLRSAPRPEATLSRSGCPARGRA